MNYSQEIEQIEKKVRTTMWITYNGESQAVERINGDNCQCGGCGNDGAIEDLLTLAKKMQEDHTQLQLKSQWIPCSERMPEENGTYLISGKSIYTFKDPTFWTDVSQFEDGDWNGRNVIAWMPLPEPFGGQV